MYSFVLFRKFLEKYWYSAVIAAIAVIALMVGGTQRSYYIALSEAVIAFVHTSSYGHIFCETYIS